MSRRNSFLSVLLAAAVVALGCGDQSPSTGMGRLDLVIQPENAAAAVQLVRGTLTLRGLDAAAGSGRRVSIAAEPYRTLSVPVVAGLYSVGWEPERTLEGLDVTEPESPIELSVDEPALPPLLIAPDQVTLLRIRSTSPGQRDPSARVLASREPLR